MPYLDPQRHVTPEEVAAALRLPDDFNSSDSRLGEIWGIGPVLLTRDSGWRAKAFNKALLDHLNSDPSLNHDWDTQRARHWGVGWCEHIIFKVLEDDKLLEPSRIFKVLMEFTDDVHEYGGVDDETENEYRREEHEEYVRNWLDRGTRDDLPDDWVEQVTTELERIDGFTDEPSGDIFVSPDKAREAIVNLGFQEVEDDEEESDP